MKTPDNTAAVPGGVMAVPFMARVSSSGWKGHSSLRRVYRSEGCESSSFRRGRSSEQEGSRSETEGCGSESHAQAWPSKVSLVNHGEQGCGLTASI